MDQWRWAEVEAACQQSLAIAREFGDRVSGCYTLKNLGRVQHDKGNWGEAEAIYLESLAIKREFSCRQSEGETLKHFAELRAAQGDIPSAVQALRQAIAVLTTTEDARRLAEVREMLAKWEQSEA